MRQKWLPLLLLGALGAVLSEITIWNIRPLADALSRHPLLILTWIVPLLGYTWLFVILADLVVRYKVRDWVGLALLGSLYGLFNEGALAGLVFAPGLGPRVLGLHPLNMAFTGLSWHAFIDVPLGFWLCRGILQDRLGLSEPGLSRRDWAAALGLALWLYCWRNFKVVRLWFPDGMPLHLQALWLLVPMALLGWLAHRALAAEPQSSPQRILKPWQAACAWGLVAFAALFRLHGIARPAALFYLAVLAAYWGLFVLHCRARPQEPERSIYEEGFPARGRLCWTKYLKLCAILLAGFTALSALGPPNLFTLLDFVMVGAMMSAAMAFPVLVVKRLLGAYFQPMGL